MSSCSCKAKRHRLPQLQAVLCCLQFSLDEDSAANKAKGNRAASQQRLREFTLDMDTGAATQRVVSDAFGDFPSIPRHLAGWQPLQCIFLQYKVCLYPMRCDVLFNVLSMCLGVLHCMMYTVPS